MNTILLIEDNAVIMASNKEYFGLLGYDVHGASTLREGEALLRAEHVDLLILDVMLPDGSGIEFCAKMRQHYDFPVLFLTCLSDDAALVAGLRAGGDEYMTKPYSLEALAARVEAMLRRVKLERSKEKAFKLGPLSIDCGKRRVYVNGEDALLTPKEFDVLLLLARDVGQGFSAEEIYRRVWGNEMFDSRTVIVHISYLRKKLRMDDESPLAIVTENRKLYSLQSG